MRARAFSAPLVLTGSRWRLVLCAVLAVAAVVVGLFTMHSMAAGSVHHETSNPPTSQLVAPHAHASGTASHDHAGDVAPMLAAAAVAEHHDEAVLSVPCDEACQMGCLMVGLMCTFALLAVLVAFRLPRLAIAMATVSDVAQCAVSGVVAAVASQRPPSLTALCVSRT